MSRKSPLNNSLRAALIAVTIGFFGCNQGGNNALTQTNTRNNNLPQVVATTSVICDFTRQIALNTVNLACLIPPGADPHIYQPKPEDRVSMQTASLILYNGYNLEPSLIRAIRNNQNRTLKIAVGQIAVSKPLQFQQGGRRVNDPHVWHNIKNAIAMVDVISRNLAKVSPENAELYTSNARQLKGELTQLDGWVKSRITTIPANQRQLVTVHNAMSYYAQAYNLSLKGTLKGISTEGKPSDANVRGLVNNIKQARVRTIFSETTTNPNLIDVARLARVKVSQRELFTDGLGEPGSEGETYQKMMTANTRTIVEGLGGTYLIFVPKARASN